MKIPAIQQKIYLQRLPQRKIASNGQNTQSYEITQLPRFYYPCNISFGIANAAKLKTLFSYDLPCMYSGVIMIDPKKVQKMLKNKYFEGSITQVLEKIKPFEKSLQGIELNVYKILQERAEYNPDWTVSEAIQSIVPQYKKELRSKQAPMFQQITAECKKLPEEYRLKFHHLMQETRDKLADRPIIVPFSRAEFKYKLEKVKEDIDKLKNIKATKVVNKLISVSEELTSQDIELTREERLKVIDFMNIILKTSVLKDNKQIKYLLDTTRSRINEEKMLVPFSRKGFIYDLNKVLADYPDKDFVENMNEIAEKLPTSRDSTAAYIMKFATEPSEKIAYRILWPSMASVEHIHPKSCGGPDLMANFGGACTRENSDRKSIDFVEQMRLRPKTPYYCQMYVDRLIELAKKGVFENNNIDIKYIEDFADTINKESRGRIVLDLSKLYE